MEHDPLMEHDSAMAHTMKVDYQGAAMKGALHAALSQLPRGTRLLPGRLGFVDGVATYLTGSVLGAGAVDPVSRDTVAFKPTGELAQKMRRYFERRTDWRTRPGVKLDEATGLPLLG